VARRTLIRVVAVAALLVATVGVTALAIGADGDDIACDDIAQEAQAWRAASAGSRDGEVSPRQRLADAFVRCRHLHGMDKPRVERLFGRRHFGSRDRWSYFIGPERGLVVVDDEVMGVRFDGDVVVEVNLGEG
jgi:hypothetical protein